jgi:hypothetical protein
LAGGQAFRCEPEKSPEGPVALLLSAADQRVVVIRNGEALTVVTADPPTTG